MNRRVLYVALLLHDIGKGRDEDHSVVGRRDRRAGWRRAWASSPRECETVEWLVRYHLLMSDMAQKRDIAEPRTVRDFAKAVGREGAARPADRAHGLRHPRRRARDLEQLEGACSCAASTARPSRRWCTASRTSTARRARRRPGAPCATRCPTGTAPRSRAELARHYGPYWLGLPTEPHAVFARLLRDSATTSIRIDIEPDDDRDATRVCFAMVDHPGPLLPPDRGAGAGRRQHPRRAHLHQPATATRPPCFWIQDAEGQPFEESRLPRLREMIDRTLKGEVVAREALKRPGQAQEARAAVQRRRPRSPSTTRGRTSTRSSRWTPATGRACSTT